MKTVIRFEHGGKDHYKDGETTVCGLELDGREFEAVAGEEVDLDNLCKRCYNSAVDSMFGTSKVVLVSDEAIMSLEEFIEPAKGQKV